MRTSLIILAILAVSFSYAQNRLLLTGQVLDAKTKEPLALATVSVKGRGNQALTSSKGRYELAVSAESANDSLYVSYLGFKTVARKISAQQTEEVFYLEEYATVLEEIVVSAANLNVRNIDKSMVVVKGKIYAQQHEVTNQEFTSFLNHLKETNQIEALKKSGFDLSAYDESTRAFFERYQTPSRMRRGKSKEELKSGDFPAVNISYDAAVAYCDWLTDQYNSNTKRKKFKKVKFRLPTLNEWQVAAIGYVKFQSWIPEENIIDVYFHQDTISIIAANARVEKMKVTKDMYYPWSRAANYMKKPMNQFGCFLGNFKIEKVAKPCYVNPPAFDGFVMMAPVESYFPNDMGLYDVVGNVAEMVAEEGKACGGSWNDSPEQSTVFSVKKYTRPESSIGFRIFMEVVE